MNGTNPNNLNYNQNNEQMSQSNNFNHNPNQVPIEQNNFNQPLNNYGQGIQGQNPNLNNQNVGMNNQNMEMNSQIPNSQNIGVNPQVGEPLSQNNPQQNMLNQADIPTRTGMNNYNYQTSSYEDDIDKEFTMPKKKFPIWIIPVILILLVLGFGLYYYFVLDNPKTIFTQAIQKTLNTSGLNFEEKEVSNAEFSLSAKIITNNEEYKYMANIINKLSIDASASVDNQEEITYANIKTKYDNQELLDFSYLMELSENGSMYLKLDGILDKVLKISPEEITTNNTSDAEITTEDYKNIINELKKALINTFNTSEFKKEYVDLDGQKVKKVTLILDKTNVTYFADQLLSSDTFVDSYIKITGETFEDLEAEFNEMIEAYSDGVEEISIYLTILKNEFIQLEDKTAEETLLLKKEDNKYSFEIYSASRIELQGFVSITKVDDKTNLIINIDEPEEELTVELDLLYKTGDTVTVDKIDTNNAVDINSLTEDDTNQIIIGLAENPGVVSLLGDLGLLEDPSSSDL